MVKENVNIRMVKFILGHLQMTYLMVKKFIKMLTEIYMRVILKILSTMDKENIHFVMEISFKNFLKMALLRVREFINLNIVPIKKILEKGKNMVYFLVNIMLMEKNF
jgi:hypothetical protein